jgi:hypothetical protein
MPMFAVGQPNGIDSHCFISSRTVKFKIGLAISYEAINAFSTNPIMIMQMASLVSEYNS